MSNRFFKSWKFTGVFGLALVLSFFTSFAASAQTRLLSIDGIQFQTKTVGTAVGSSWLLWSNGLLENSYNFPSSSTYQFQIQATGEVAASVWPNMEIRIDQKLIRSFSVNSTLSKTYSVSVPVTAGVHRIQIAFTNDYYTSNADRNLYVKHLDVLSSSPTPAPVPTPAPTVSPAPSPSPAPLRTEIQRMSTPDLVIQPGQNLSFSAKLNAVPMSEDLWIFVHFVDANGVQHSALNAGGSPAVPTSKWSGPVSVPISVMIPANAVAGKYSVRMGLFRNVSPWNVRFPMNLGSGVTVDNELRYTVGSLTIGGSAPVPAPAPSSGAGPYGLDANAYVMTFSDEFENGFNTAKWNNTTWDRPASPVQNYAVENGMLRIWPQQAPDGSFPARVIDTDGKFYQTYGYYEIEAKLPIGLGVWPAFWLYNHDQVNTNFRPEIDIMEAYSGGGPASGWSDANLHPTTYAPTIWTGQPGVLGGTKMVQGLGDLSAGFHRYGLKWEPNRQTFYFDGREVYTVAVTMPNRMYVMLDLLYGSASGTPTAAGTPQGRNNAFDIRYVRIWKFK